MISTVLVGYATRYGSTKEVAEAVANTLREEGFTVEIQSLRDIRSLKGMEAVIMGAPLQMFHWHPEAMRFLSRFKDQLLNLPIAVFALGPFHTEETEFTQARTQLSNDLAKSPWFSPIDVTVFGGKFDPAVLAFPMNMLPALKQMPAVDIRDWDVIREWAKRVGEKFQTGV